MQIASPYMYSSSPQSTTLSFQNSGLRDTVSSENSGSVFQPVTESKSTAPISLQSSVSRSEEDAENQASSETEAADLSEEITEQEQQQILELSARDTEVRNHERAHAAVGGQYAGAPEYQYERGPDGINYAVAGEVSISTSKIPGDPQATIEKAQIVRRAALAPAEPSTQDRRVAAMATQMEAEARVELSRQRQEAAVEESEEVSSTDEDSEQTDEKPTSVNSSTSAFFRNDVNNSSFESDFTTAIDSTRRLLSSSYNSNLQTSGNIFSRYA